MRLPLTLLLVLAALAPPAVSHASGAQRFGPQIGFSESPDQIFAGVHFVFADIAPRVDFVPSVDLGGGDDQTVLSLNGDFHFRFRVSGSRWEPYAGAGLAVHSVHVNFGPFDHTETVSGGNVMFGAEVPTRRGSTFGAEARFGFGDSPSMKLLARWSFALR